MTEPLVHPAAFVSPGAVLGRSVSVGPFAIVEEGAVVGNHCTIAGRAVVKGGVELGEHNAVHEGAVIGGYAQHLHTPEATGRVLVGNHNVFRENVTVHRALADGAETRIGDHNLLMVGVHVAHDCVLGDHVIIANNVLLAGHITIEDRANLSGMVGIHQHIRIGRCAMLGGMAHLKVDVPPYVTVCGDTNRVVGLNVVGLKRAGYTDKALFELKRAYRILYRSGSSWQETLDALWREFPSGPAAHFHTFLSECRRGIVQERRAGRRERRPATAVA